MARECWIRCNLCGMFVPSRIGSISLLLGVLLQFAVFSVMSDEGVELKEGMDAKKSRLLEKGYFAFLIVHNAVGTLKNWESA